MVMYWDKCFLCQTGNGSKLRSEDASLETIADRLPKFKEAGGTDQLDFSQINDGSCILNTLKKKKAMYS